MIDGVVVEKRGGSREIEQLEGMLLEVTGSKGRMAAGFELE